MLDDLCEPNYSIVYYDRYDRSINSPVNISEIQWGRKIDAISTSTITYVVSDDSCCEQLGVLEPIAHKIGIKRNEELAWYGWLENVEYGRNEIIVNSFDALGWLQRRVIRDDLSWTNADLTTIFTDIYNNALSIDPISAEIVQYPSGTTATREEKQSAFRVAWSAVSEMLDTGLDITVFGQKILAGVIPTTRPIELTLNDMQGDVRVQKAGKAYGNRIISDANDATVGVYPPGPATGNAIYPLTEVVIRDGQLQDQASADNAAKSRYEYSRYVPRLVTTQDALVLNPNFNAKVNELIPGMKVIIDTTGICYVTRQEMRLGSIDVSVSGGSEKVSISLQPTGAAEGLDTAESAL